MQDDQTSFRPVRLRGIERGGAARRRLQSAFLPGAAIFLVGAVLFAGEFAKARGPTPALFDIGPTVYQPEVPIGDRPFHGRSKSVASGGGPAVCVRLCDGFFFPSVSSSGGDEACASQCPDAPTAFYSMRAGSDRIEDAVSLRGEPYTALPVADHNQLSFDSTCTCHRSFTRSYLTDLLHDRTLRNGDLVMTARGFAVFRGDKSGGVSASNFVALSQSTSVPKNSRAELTAMEHAGIWDRQTGPYSYSSPEAVTAAAATSTPRPRKGIVTVDDGEPTPLK